MESLVELAMTLEPLTSLDPDVRVLLPEFLRNGRIRLVRLEQFLAEGALDDIRRLGHGLKGSGGMYELHGFERLGERIEDAALAGDPAALPPIFNEVRALLDVLEGALSQSTPAPECAR